MGHQVKAKVISDVPKVSVGPKHYGAPIQKLPPSDKVMSAILQWKTSETMRFLAGSLPDFSKDDGDDEVSQNWYKTRPEIPYNVVLIYWCSFIGGY